jgi:hypothetical protein
MINDEDIHEDGEPCNCSKCEEWKEAELDYYFGKNNKDLRYRPISIDSNNQVSFPIKE